MKQGRKSLKVKRKENGKEPVRRNTAAIKNIFLIPFRQGGIKTTRYNACD